MRILSSLVVMPSKSKANAADMSQLDIASVLYTLGSQRIQDRPLARDSRAQQVRISVDLNALVMHQAHAAIREDYLLQATWVMRLCLAAREVVYLDAVCTCGVPGVCFCIVVLHAACRSK